MANMRLGPMSMVMLALWENLLNSCKTLLLRSTESLTVVSSISEVLRDEKLKMWMLAGRLYDKSPDFQMRTVTDPCLLQAASCIS